MDSGGNHDVDHDVVSNACSNTNHKLSKTQSMCQGQSGTDHDPYCCTDRNIGHDTDSDIDRVTRGWNTRVECANE